jgi:hypothetical protein
MTARKAQKNVVLPAGCPECEGDVVEAVRSYSLGGEFFGNYLFWVCSQGGYELVPLVTARQIQEVAKAKGLFRAYQSKLPHVLAHVKAANAHA